MVSIDKVKTNTKIIKFILPEYTNVQDAKMFVERLLNNIDSTKADFNYYEIGNINGTRVGKEEKPTQYMKTWEVVVTIYKVPVEIENY